MYVTHHTRSLQREGVILLVVLIMLTLFAIVGISFVLYANSQAEASRIKKITEDLPAKADMRAEDALAMFLSQYIYDVKDEERADGSFGIYSSLRAHSLGRTSFEAHPTAMNDKPFNGTGRLRESTPNGISFQLINYTYFKTADSSFIRHPDYLYSASSGTSPGASDTYVGQSNPGYTYPDENSVFLAMVRASD